MVGRSWRWIGFGVLSALTALSGAAAAQSPEEYRARREAVRSKMEAGSALVLRSPVPSGGRFRQEDALYYLTGIEEPNTALILRGPHAEGAPGGPTARPGPPMETLFVMPEGRGRATAARAGESSSGPAIARPGFDHVRSYLELQSALDELLTGAGPRAVPVAEGGSGHAARGAVIYLDYQRSRRLTDPLTGDEQWLKAARDRGFVFTIRSALALVNPLRRVKSPAEIEHVRTAVAITSAAHREAMRAASPGMYEYQLQSIIEHVFSINGAVRVAFPSIVGSGPNGVILHWSENSRQTRPGDLVVIDIGAEYRRYASDVTRTIPISGIFTPRQRVIYETVLRANEAAIAMIAPGVTMRDINARVNAILGEGLVALGLITDVRDLRKYYTHGLSHGVGLAVHDVNSAVLEPGVILTIEPGLYVPEENLGVRIEDTVLVTPTGHDVLSAGAPKSVAAIEALMREPGLDYSRYLVVK